MCECSFKHESRTKHLPLVQEKLDLECAQRKEENYQAYIREVSDECLSIVVAYIREVSG